MRSHLPITGTRLALFGAALAAFSGSAAAGPVAMTGSGSYSQNFNTLPTSGTTNTWANDTTLTAWYAEQASGTLSTIRADAGTSTTGALYSYGTGTNTERALGSLGSGTPVAFAYGVLLQNTSASSLVIDSLAYTGEQWRRADNVTPHKLTFSYKKDTSAITALTSATPLPGGWTAVTAADFTGPQAAATALALDGNLAANEQTISTNPNIVVGAGEYVFLRWHDPNDSGNDHGLGIDNLTVNWSVTATPSLSVTATATTFSESAANPASVGTVTIPAALGADLVVSLSSNDTTEATVPASVTILAGQTSANFDITAVDDLLFDGNQSVTITATASGYNNGTLGLTVENDFDAKIVVSFSVDPILENAGPNASTGTVQLAAAVTSDTVITLTSSNTAEATVPATATVLTGNDFVQFPIDAIDDSVVDGNKTSLITAAATGYTSGNATLHINDDGNDVPSPATLAPGDIAFTGFNADGNDDVAFVALVNIAAGDSIYFTDNNWNGGTLGSGGAFATNEGAVKWTAPVGGVAAGAIVQLNNISVTGRTATVGTLAGAGGSFNLAAAGDTIYAYQGAAISPTGFVAAAKTNTDSTVGTGLSAAHIIVLTAGVDTASYTGSRTNQTSFANYRTLVNNAANWITQDGSGDNGTDGIPPEVPFSNNSFTLLVGSTYASYATSHGLSTHPNEDTDKDGVANGVEYLMGAATGFTSNGTLSGNTITWPYDATATDATFVVQTSSDLVTWTTVTHTLGANSISYTLPSGQGKIFVQLKVQATSP